MDKEKIRLLNDKIYDIDDIQCLFNLMKITFTDNIDNHLINDPSVFNTIEILTRGGSVCGSYNGYNTVYKQDGNTLILSNDNSVYIKPSKPAPPPTEELTLEQVKSDKIEVLSNICNSYIEQGIDLEINDSIEHFSYKAEDDQTNIKDAFDLVLQTGLSVPYHCNGGSCKLYTADQIISLYIAQKMNLTHHTTYFNQLKMYTESLNTIEEVNEVTYGQELIDEYLEAYNIAMNQANVVINSLLENYKRSEG